MNNTAASLKDLVHTQSNSLLGNITAELDKSSDYSANTGILQKVLDNEKVVNDIARLKDYLEYYDNNNSGNFHEITMVLRLGLRIGAYYMIEDHKANQYEYYD